MGTGYRVRVRFWVSVRDILYGDPGISDLTTGDCHLDVAISFGGGAPKDRTHTSMLIGDSRLTNKKI